MIKLGAFEIQSIINGTVRLDGGAMFGVVPKALWQNVTDVDDQNRIPLATRTLLAVDKEHNRVILVDTGCGSKWPADLAKRFGIDPDPQAIPNALAKCGLTTEDVTDVIITHLHFDHNGGLTDWYDEPGGKTVLRYPQAKHWIHKGHWLHAQKPYLKDQASFLKQDFEALEDAGVLNFVEGDSPTSSVKNDSPMFSVESDSPTSYVECDSPTSAIDGVSWWVSQGHTPYQLHPIFGSDSGSELGSDLDSDSGLRLDADLGSGAGADFGSGGDQLLFIGDIAPTIAHLRQAWVMAYDVEPLKTIREKETIFRRALDQGIKIAFPHDPKHGGVTLDGTASRPIVASTLAL